MSNRQFSVLTQVVSEATGAPGTTGRGAYLAGLGLNESIDETNSLVDVWFLLAFANLSLVSGQRTYALSTALPNYSTHVTSIMLNAAGTTRERFVLYLPMDDFARAGYESNDYIGAPSYLTCDPYADLLRLDRDPGATFNGRTLRTLYYRKLSRLSISTATFGIDDSAENWIVQDAQWRARRYAGIPDWRDWKSSADATKTRLIAKPQSVDLAALGLM